MSCHGIGLSDGIELAKKIGFKKKVRIFGIQPYQIANINSLSNEMLNKMNVIYEKLYQAVFDFRNDLLLK